MQRLLIVDGSNLLFQMFFGMPSRIVNQHGKAIQGTLGFVGALLKMIKLTKPTHIAVLFDGEHENSRADIDHNYKANRIDYSKVNEENNPYSQLADVYNALDYLKINHAETVFCEVDDWVAGYALTYGKENEIIISSFDSDFFQLITDNVSVLRYRGKSTVVCTPDYIKERYDIIPAQYADFKAITGDTADNIKGAEKIGIKTAAMLLNELGNLENILKNADDIKKKSVRESIIRNSERLKTNYRIIKLDNCDKLPFRLENLKYSYNGITTNEVLKETGLK